MISTARQLAALGAASGFLAVALGAFGAHALRDELSVRYLEIFQTGVHYQMAHALATILAAVLLGPHPQKWIRVGAWCFLSGTILFSGSLYTLALTGNGAFGAVTPGGGVLFLVGWTALGLGCLRQPATESSRPGPEA